MRQERERNARRLGNYEQIGELCREIDSLYAALEDEKARQSASAGVKSRHSGLRMWP